MDRLVDHLFVFEGDGVISDYPGNYSQLRESKKNKGDELVAVPKTEVKQEAAQPVEKKRLSYNEQREFETLEKELGRLERERKGIYEQLSSPDLPFDQLQKLSERINQINDDINLKEMRWLELSEAQS
jgi:ATP-binding cassette subfamily F protein uup